MKPIFFSDIKEQNRLVPQIRFPHRSSIISSRLSIFRLVQFCECDRSRGYQINNDIEIQKTTRHRMILTK